MKRPLINTRLSPRVLLAHIKVVALAAFMASPVLAVKADSYWQGPVNGSADYNIAANWNPAIVPSLGTNADNDNGSNSIVLVQNGDPTWDVNDIRAGNETNDSGTYIQSGSTINLGGWFRLGVSPGAVGYYTLNNGAINYNGGDFNVGELGTGVLNVTGGTITGSGNFADDLGNNDSTTITDIVNQTGGIIAITGQLFVGNNGNGIYNMSGGTNSVANYIAFGRSGGIGTFNMTGGVLNQQGNGNLLIGTGYQAPSGVTAVGVLNQSGGTINSLAQVLVPETSPSLGTYNMSGTAVLNAHDWIAIGRDGATGVLNITNGVITRDNANDSGGNFTVGSGGQGTVNQYGGAVTNLAGTTFIGESATAVWNLNGGSANLGNIIIADQDTASGTFNLNGGVLEASSIVTPGEGFSELNLNGGTLRANASTLNFMNGIAVAEVGPGGFVFDSQGYDVTVPQVINDNGGGSFTKIGSGTLSLIAYNSYAGPTLINAGTLATTTAAGTSSSGYTVGPGAALSVQVASAGSQFSVPALAFSSGASTLDIDLNTFGAPPAAPLNVGTLTLNGTVTLNVLAEAPVATGTYPLVQYSSFSGSGSFVLGSLPPGETAQLSTAGGTVSLVVTSAAVPKWNGNISSVWDVNTTENWINVVNSSPITFNNGEPVLFDDTATGTTSVTLNTAVTPGSIAFNNTALPYSLTGSGAISGGTGLLKEGTNTVALLNSGGNTYTGPTVIAAGILNITNLANGGSPSAIGASSANPTNLVLDGGTLSYTGPAVSLNRGYDLETNSVIDAGGNLTFSGSVVSASGADFVKTGPASLIYSTVGTNALAGSGGYSVAGGAVVVAGSGTGQTDTIGGTLAINSTNGVAAAVAISNATLNVQGGLDVGQALGAGALSLNTGAVLNGSGTVDVGDGGGSNSVGTVTQVGGAFNSPGQLWVGNGNSGTGSYTLSGGTFNIYNWLAIGRAGATGTLTISGNAVLADFGGGGGNLDIGTSGGIGGVAGSGTVNQTGGAVSNTASQTWLGEGSAGEPATGTWNMSGGTALLGQLNVGQGGTGVSSVNISGTATLTSTVYVDLGAAAGATGNLNIGPGGSFTDTGDMAVGDQGNGTLNLVANGGGLATVEGTLYLSRGNATAVGVVNLNAGTTLTAGYINNGYGFGAGVTNNPQSFNFNGGTLKAFVGSPYFIQPYVNAVVQSGGAIINDDGFSISVLASLVNGGGGGGLTKLGAGTLYLDGANTYTGATMVSTGTLAGVGSIAGPVTVSAGATLGAGEGNGPGTLTIHNTLTLAAGSTTSLRIGATGNDAIAGLTGVTYGGALVIDNTSGAVLNSGAVYQLFSTTGPVSGNFNSVTVMPVGTSATFNPRTGQLTIGATSTVVNAPVYSGGNIILTGSGGTPNGPYTVLSATNLATPFADWTTNGTGVFGTTGTFSNAIPVSHSLPDQFFNVRAP